MRVIHAYVDNLFLYRSFKNSCVDNFLVQTIYSCACVVNLIPRQEFIPMYRCSSCVNNLFLSSVQNNAVSVINLFLCEQFIPLQIFTLCRQVIPLQKMYSMQTIYSCFCVDNLFLCLCSKLVPMLEIYSFVHDLLVQTPYSCVENVFLCRQFILVPVQIISFHVNNLLC